MWPQLFREGNNKYESIAMKNLRIPLVEASVIFMLEVMVFKMAKNTSLLLEFRHINFNYLKCCHLFDALLIIRRKPKSHYSKCTHVLIKLSTAHWFRQKSLIASPSTLNKNFIQVYVFGIVASDFWLIIKS